jgi:hypothetical protein
VGLKLNETHQLLVYADYVGNIDTANTKTETPIYPSEEVGLEANAN